MLILRKKKSFISDIDNIFNFSLFFSYFQWLKIILTKKISHLNKYKNIKIPAFIFCFPMKEYLLHNLNPIALFGSNIISNI